MLEHIVAKTVCLIWEMCEILLEFIVTDDNYDEGNDDDDMVIVVMYFLVVG